MGYPHASGTWLSPPLVADNKQTTNIWGRQLPSMAVVCLVAFPLCLLSGVKRERAFNEGEGPNLEEKAKWRDEVLCDAGRHKAHTERGQTEKKCIYGIDRVRVTCRCAQ